MLSVVREPNGRHSRQGEPREFPPTAIKRLRDAALSRMEDACWGSELGRLFLADKIDAPALAAGQKWAEIAKRYCDAIGASTTPRSAALERGTHAASPDPDSAAGSRIVSRERVAIVAFHRAHERLIAAGKLAENAVRSVCERDETAISELELDSLCAGLMALAGFWHLTGTQRASRGQKFS